MNIKENNFNISNETPKILSFYLPQFHEIPENNLWHGEGFTEWTKVRQAKSLFVGHDQPRIPHEDIGYYDLRDKETLSTQANLMSNFGIDGQIFYHYWFTGKLILEEPAQLLLAHKEIPMPFAFCWANENWTRRWDGGDGQVLISQEYSLGDAEEFINYLIPFFQDERYIKIDGRPLLIVYRTALIPDLEATVEIWNGICLENGVQPPFLLAMETQEDERVLSFGFQGTISRPMYNWPLLRGIPGKEVSYLEGHHQGHIWDFEKVSNFYRKELSSLTQSQYPCVVVGWDTSPRHKESSNICVSASASDYEIWLGETIEFTKNTHSPGRQMVFINAWNEWAEGAYLEPDLQNGYAYLNATQRAITNHS